MTKIIATRDFEGTCNEFGTRSMTYLSGEVYDVHDHNAAVFFDGNLAKPFEEPSSEPDTKTPEAKAKKSGFPRKGKSSAPAKG